MTQDTLKLLANIPIFSKVASQSLSEIIPFFREKTYRSGEILFNEGSLGKGLYIIIEGEIEISKRDKCKQGRITLAKRRNGDVIGEMSVFGEEPRFADALVITDTRVLELSMSDFRRMIYEHPQIAYQIMVVLSSRIKQSDLHMVDELKKKDEQLRAASENVEAAAEALRKSSLQQDL